MTITAAKLRKLFIEYNEKYFDGFLTMPKISTYIGVNSMGVFSVREWKTKIEQEISIARNFKLTDEELRDLLLHEMIHQYVYKKYGKINHGKDYKRLKNELNKNYGFDIRINSKHLFKKYLKKKSLFEKLLSLFRKNK